jgi:hypothetical protein
MYKILKGAIPSSIYVFWLPFWYLVAIVFSVLPRFTFSDYPFGSKSRKDRQYNGHMIPKGKSEVVNRGRADNTMTTRSKGVIRSRKSRRDRQYNGCKIPKGILWPLYCLSFLDLRLLITPLVSCSHWPKGKSEVVNRGRTDNTMTTRSKGVIRSRKSRRERQYNGRMIPKG